MKELYRWLKIKSGCSEHHRQSTQETAETERSLIPNTASQIQSITYMLIVFIQKKSLTLWQAAPCNLEPGA